LGAAVALHLDVYATVLGAIAVLLLLGAAAYRWLPQPPHARAAERSQSSP